MSKLHIKPKERHDVIEGQLRKENQVIKLVGKWINQNTSVTRTQEKKSTEQFQQKMGNQHFHRRGFTNTTKREKLQFRCASEKLKNKNM